MMNACEHASLCPAAVLWFLVIKNELGSVFSFFLLPFFSFFFFGGEIPPLNCLQDSSHQQTQRFSAACSTHAKQREICC